MSNSSTTKRVLVTGGAGYIGSHLVRKLLRSGYTVHVLDNFTYGSRAIDGIADHPRLKIFTGDICSIKDLVRAVQGTNSIVALAAIVGDPACNLNERETLNTNYEATKVLVEIAKYYKVKRLLFASSCSVYGANSELELNEGSLLHPISLYAKTRVMSEEVILQNCGDVCPVILRLSTVFGVSERMRFDLVVNILAAKAFFEGQINIFGGRQYRPNVHVQDAANAFVLGLQCHEKDCFKQIFNVGSNDQNYRIQDIGKIVRKILPRTRIRIHPEKDDARDYRVNFEKAACILKFRPKFSVEQGVRELVSGFRKKRFANYTDDIYYNVKYLYR